MKFNYFIVNLLAMQWIAGVSTAGNGRLPSCCPSTSKDMVNIMKIERYIYQTPPCYIKAVRFLLKSGKVICSDPNDAWAKHAIKYFDSRSSTKAPNTPLSSTSTTANISSPGTTTESTVTMTIPKGTLTNTNKMTTSTTNSTPIQYHLSSPGTTTESTVTMTIPKGTLITWKPTSFIQSISTKRPLKNTNKPPQQTSIQTIKMTTSTDIMPSITDFEMTSMTTLTTTKSPTMPVGISITWKPTTYITHKASAKELSRNSKKPPHWMTTRQIPTTEKRKTVTPDTMTTSMTRTTEYRVTLTTPKETSTTQRPVQKTTTTNVTTQTTRCPPFRKNNLDKGNSPWTVKRLKKKRKPGLRRVQMNAGCIEH